MRINNKPNTMEDIRLNKKQQTAIVKLEDFINQDTYDSFYLLGYAGTGKTYVIINAIPKILLSENIRSIFLCAPTHKALGVMISYFTKSIPDTYIDIFTKKAKFLTLHSLLEYRPIVVNSTGAKTFVTSKKYNNISGNKRDIIIIDECSMIPENLTDSLQKYALAHKIKIVYLGDVAQLSPIGEISSKIFTSITDDYDYYIMLDEIMRTKSVDIRKVSMIVRETTTFNMESLLHIYGNQTDKHFFLYHSKEDYMTATWFKNFIIQVKKNKNPIILAWRNKTVDNYNDYIRRYLHGKNKCNRYIIGDRVIFNGFYMTRGVIYYTSDIVEIASIEEAESGQLGACRLMKDEELVDIKGLSELIAEMDKLERVFRVQTLTVNKVYSDTALSLGDTPGKVNTIYPMDLQIYREYSEKIRRSIESFTRKCKSDKCITSLWSFFHARIVDKYADIGFCHSMTIHKSQGSTFNYVYVDIKDISTNTNEKERNRLLYTATTRAADMLGFIV